MKGNVYVEYCIDCQDHFWSTNHDESKYLDYFHRLKEKIIQKHPGLKVIDNSLPSPLRERIIGHDSHPKSGIAKKFMPRIGAFEIYYNNSVIFSKLKTGVWPNLDIIVNQLINAVPAATAVHSNVRINNNNRSRTTIKNLAPLNRSHTATKLLRCYNKDRLFERPLNPILHLKKKNESIKNKTWNRQATKIYNLNFFTGEISKAKISYTNLSDQDSELTLWTNDRGFLLKEKKTTVLANDKVKIRMGFRGPMNQCEKTYFLYIDKAGKPLDTIKFVVNYT